MLGGGAATSVGASETRVAAFAFPCDGSAKISTFNATGLGNSVTRFIQGAEITLIENRGGLQYVFLNAQNNSNKQLLSVADGENHSVAHYTGFLQVTTDATGNISFSIIGSCLPGAGQVQGIATVFFFS